MVINYNIIAIVVILIIFGSSMGIIISVMGDNDKNSNLIPSVIEPGPTSDTIQPADTIQPFESEQFQYIIPDSDTVYDKPTSTVVDWPRQIEHELVVEFKFIFLAQPINNYSTILDCQNQSKLGAGWKLYFERNQPILSMRAGNMNMGESSDKTIYTYTGLNVNETYTIRLIFTDTSIKLEINDDLIYIEGFYLSTSMLWDSNLYIGQDNQYTNRNLEDGMFKLSHLQIYLNNLS